MEKFLDKIRSLFAEQGEIFLTFEQERFIEAWNAIDFGFALNEFILHNANLEELNDILYSHDLAKQEYKKEKDKNNI